MINENIIKVLLKLKLQFCVALLVALSTAFIEITTIYLLGSLIAKATQSNQINLMVSVPGFKIETVIVFTVIARLVLGITAIYAKTNLVNKVRKNILLDFNIGVLKSNREFKNVASKSEFQAAFFTELNVFCYGFLNHLMQLLNDIVILILFMVFLGSIFGIENLIWLLLSFILVGSVLVVMLRAGRKYGLSRQIADQSISNLISSIHDASGSLIVENKVLLYESYLKSSLIKVGKANLAAQTLIGMPKILVDTALLVVAAIFALVFNTTNVESFALGDATVLLLLIVRGLPVCGRLVTTLQNLSYTKVSINAVSKQYNRLGHNLIPSGPDGYSQFSSEPERSLQCGFQAVTGDTISHVFSASDGLIVIKGESGVGKTTFLKAIGGISTFKYPQFVSKNKQKPKFAMIAQNGIEFNYDLNDFLNYTDQKVLSFSRMLNINVGEFQNFRSVEEIKSRYSGGEFERIQLIRCLSSDIDVLLMDETGSGLDREHKHAMIKALEKREDIIRILVTHDDFLIRNASRVIEMT
tara:strand:- start:1171 stop:2751 length:1581 start_codon:yes stop_codon:yes gene_type:complete